MLLQPKLSNIDAFFKTFVLKIWLLMACLCRTNNNLFTTIYIIANVLKGEKTKRKNKNNKKVNHKKNQILKQQEK